MSRSALVVLVVFVVAASSGVVLATGSSGVADARDVADTGDRLEQRYAAPDDETSQEFDSTTFEVTVHENGDATWTFRYERLLEDEDEVDAFEEFAAEFREEETDFYLRFTEQAQALADTGTAETDREMDATEFDRTADVDHRPNPMGYVEMSFTWTGFAPVDDDGTVVVGDVFDGGLYIGPSQSFVVRPGDGLTFGAEPIPSDGEYAGTSVENSDFVAWSGERDFHDGQPRIVLEPTGTDGAPAGDGGDETSSWPLAAGLLALGLAGAFAWYRYAGTPDAPDSSDDPDDRPPSTAAEAEPVPDEELLTDEDRVVALIRENGGRMKQVDIVEETDWSKSKVSMLLSDMEEAGTISKLRVGRENIISLEGHEPEAAKSPLEE